MQVDSERLFTNKGPVMVTASDIFQNGLIRGQYTMIKVTYNDQKRSKSVKNVTISYNTTLHVFFLVINSMET